MQLVSDVIKNMGFTTNKNDTNVVENHVSDEQSYNIEEIVNIIFKDMSTIFPAFLQAWPNQASLDHAKMVWTKILKENGPWPLERLKRGLMRFAKSCTPFVPTPGQFIHMCGSVAEEMGLPSLPIAYAEACRNAHPCVEKRWSHIVVRVSAANAGSFNLSNLPRKDSLPLFEYHYKLVCDKFLAGEPFENEEPPVALKDDRPVTKEVMLSALEQMKRMLR